MCGNTRCFEGSTRRWYIYLLAYIITALTSGLVYAWPVLILHLRKMGSILSNERLTQIYTLGAFSTQGNQLLFGIARDRYGTKISTVISLVCVVGGLVGISFSDPNGVAQLGVCIFFIGLGSGGQLCLQPVAALFVGWTSTVLLSLSGAFNLSGLVFIILDRIFDDSKIAFLWFAGVIMLLVIVASLVLPVGSSFVLPDDAIEEEVIEENLDEDNNNAEIEVTVTSENLPESDVLPNGEEIRTAYNQIKNVEYIALVGWFSVCVTPLQYYLTAIQSEVFSIIYAFGAVICPLLGFTDFFGLGFSQCIGSTLCAVSFFLLNSNDKSVQIASFIFYTVGRIVVYGMFFSYVGKRFGFTNFGTLSGIGLLISSIVSLCLPAINKVASEQDKKVSEQDKKVVNYTLGIILIGMLPYCAWVNKLERRDRQFS